MNNLIIAAGGCFLLGIMTTLHPCPLATNIAAISMLVGWSKKSRKALMISLLFIAGYVGTFVSLSIILGSGILTVPAAAGFLHQTVPLFIGPLLIITGMLFADLLNANRLYQGFILRQMQSKHWTGFHAFPMGVLLALSFCPATAAIFFGLLIPMALKQERIILFPLLYSAGASFPLIVMSLLINQGSRITLNESWKKKIPLIAGWILILTGIFISIRQIYMG